jgi:SAM-dependent methyltransferase
MHDASVYERLHRSGAIDYYREYRDLAAQAKHHFDRHDLNGLQRCLSRWSKYRFIINQLRAESPDARVLEVGCSRGYLTSYSILAGRSIIGTDVALEAIESARAAFGDHFTNIDSPSIKLGAPYDVVYHVGLIGCVADPIELTNGLLSLLKPGGKLLFNAPNRASCSGCGQLWIDSAPPPDVVTLFAPGFWRSRFTDIANVTELLENLSADESLRIGLQRTFRRSWKKPVPRALVLSEQNTSNGFGSSGTAWRMIERTMMKLGRMSRLSHVVSRQPSEFGLFVTMTRT